jgi:uncharacterized protein (PEP-CTERM system associated)
MAIAIMAMATAVMVVNAYRRTDERGRVAVSGNTRSARLFSAVVVCVLVGSVQAGDWTVSPRGGVRQNYSDNIFLDPADLGRHDWVTELLPGIDIQGNGRRLNLSLFYTAQGLYYARGSGRSEVNHRLQAGGTVEAIEDLMYVDFSANFRQELFDLERRVVDDNINVVENRVDVFTARIVPSFRKQFGSYGTGTAIFDIGTSISGGEVDQATDFGNFTVSFSSGSRFARLPWSISYRRKTQQTDSGNDPEFNRVDLNASYKVNRKIGLLGAIGYESNSSATADAESESVTWRIGGSFTPNRRTSIDGGFQKRSFGTGVFFSGRYTHRRIAIFADYDEEFTTAAEEQLERRLVPLEDAFGNPIRDPDTNELLLIPTDVATISDEVFVHRGFRGGLSYNGRRRSAKVRGWHTTRDFGTDGEDINIGVAGSITHRFNARVALNIAGQWSTSELASGTSRERWDVGASMSKSLNRTLTASLEVRHREQTSDFPLDEYTENRASLFVNKTF